MSFINEEKLRQWFKNNPRLGGLIWTLLSGAALYGFVIKPWLANEPMNLAIGLIGTLGCVFGCVQIARGRIATDSDKLMVRVAYVLTGIFMLLVLAILFFGDQLGLRIVKP